VASVGLCYLKVKCLPGFRWWRRNRQQHLQHLRSVTASASPARQWLVVGCTLAESRHPVGNGGHGSVAWCKKHTRLSSPIHTPCPLRSQSTAVIEQFMRQNSSPPPEGILVRAWSATTAAAASVIVNVPNRAVLVTTVRGHLRTMPLASIRYADRPTDRSSFTGSSPRLAPSPFVTSFRSTTRSARDVVVLEGW